MAGWLLHMTPVIGSGPIGQGIPALVNVNNCNLDAPDNFHVVDIGADFISVEWDAVTNAQAYYLEATSSSNGQLVYNTTVAGTSATLLVPAGGIYDVSVAAVATDCPPSSNRASIPNVITLIVDLIATGKTEPEGTIQVFLENNCIEEPRETGNYWFKISKNNTFFAKYEIDRKPIWSQSTDCMVNLLSSIGRVNINFRNTQGFIFSDNGDLPPCAEGRVVKIKTTGSPVIDLFELSFEGTTSNVFKVCINQLAGSEYSYTLWAEGGDLSSPEDRSASISTMENSAISIQNPFSTDVHISSLEPASGPVRFQLFNLNGTSVLEQQFPARQEYNLPTAGLPPGFYLLRMESGGASRTYKVVKAQ